MNVAIVLNWCSFQSTKLAVESILENSPLIDLIVVVDNNSPDGSGEKLSGFFSDREVRVPVKIILNDFNSGYAGGNNVGINFALDFHPNVRFIWILNSDAKARKNSFESMYVSAQKNPMCFYGSVVVQAGTELVECVGGGKVYPILGKSKLIGKGRLLADLYDIKQPDYLMGCSLLVSRGVIEKIGLMDESYFMYSEELDWQWTAKYYGIGIAVIGESVVEHEGGGSAGGKGSFYHYYRNRGAIMFNRKFYGLAFSIISAFNLSFITLLQNWRTPSNVIAGCKGAWAGIKKSSACE